MNKGFLLIAHRGGKFHRPENSLAAFQFCVENGILWVECDVRLTCDGCPVLAHDDRLPMDGSLTAVRDLSWTELQEYRAVEGEQVPSLAQALEIFSSKLRFNLELKEIDAASATIEIIKAYQMEERVLFSSFLPDALAICQKSAPEISRGLLIDRLAGRLTTRPNLIQGARLLGCRSLLPHFSLVSADLVMEARESGLSVIPWTVNTGMEVEALLQWGVKGIITDKPLLIRSALNRLDP